MNSEKVKEIKKALEEEILVGDANKLNFTRIDFNLLKDTLTLINELESENELLTKENETLRNAKVIYETVDYCAEDFRKAEKRIAELEEELKNYKKMKDL